MLNNNAKRGLSIRAVPFCASRKSIIFITGHFVKNLQDVSSNISESLSSLSKVNYDDLKNEFDKLNSKTSDDKKGEGSK